MTTIADSCSRIANALSRWLYPETSFFNQICQEQGLHKAGFMEHPRSSETRQDHEALALTELQRAVSPTPAAVENTRLVTTADKSVEYLAEDFESQRSADPEETCMDEGSIKPFHANADDGCDDYQTAMEWELMWGGQDE